VRESLERVIVVGTSCCGKTVFARRLAHALGSPHIELDALYWGPDWIPKPEAEFRRLTEVATATPRWVVDGNYGVVRDLLWPRATSVVWLNYRFPTVLGRALRRTIRRAVSRERLFSGNRESFTRSFLSRDSILVWVLSTHGRRRRCYEALRTTRQFPRIHWLEFRRPREAEAFLEAVRPEPC
jgi:adenylate kinase family enzyme